MTYQGCWGINAPVSINLSRLSGLYESKPICPRHPGPLWEVIKRLAAHQLHGNFTPGRFSVGCSHCLRRLCAGKRYHARTVTEQEYRPIVGRGRTGSRPIFCSRCFSLRAGQTDLGRNDKVASWCPVQRIMAQRLNQLATMGKCLMNGYEIVKGQTHSP